MDQLANSVPNTDNRFNISDALLDGKSMSEIKSFVQGTNVPTIFDSPEKFKEKYPTLPAEAYSGLINKYHQDVATDVVNKQQAGEFSPTNALMDYSKWQLAPTKANIDRGYKTYAPTPSESAFRTAQIEVETPGGGSLQQYTPNEVASKNDFFMDKFGKIQPISLMDKLTTNPVQFEMTPDGNGAYWKEIGDDQYLDPTKMKSWMGDATVHTGNVLTSIPRGLWSGGVPLILKGTGAIFSLANTAYSDITNFNDMITPGAYVKPEKTWMYYSSRWLSNTGSQMTKMNLDEQQGLFSNWANTLYNVSNGITQIVGTMLPSTAIGGLLAKVGATATWAERGGEVAGILAGASQSNAMMQDQLRTQNFDEEDVQRFGALYMIPTILSESVPWARLPIIKSAKLGVKWAGKMEAREGAELINSPVGAVLNDVAKDQSGIRKIVSKALNFTQTPQFKSQLKETLAAGLFEGLEEFPVESTMQGWVSDIHNATNQVWAKNYNEMSNGWSIDANPDGIAQGKPFKLIDSKGNSKPISESEMATINADKKRADDILTGKLVDDQWTGNDWRQSLVATLSTFASMGIMSGVGSMITRKNTLSQQNRLAGVGIDIALGNQKRETMVNVFNELDSKHGYWGSHDVDINGKPKTDDNPDFVSQADYWKGVALQTIDSYTQIAKDYKLTSPQVMTALNVGKQGQDNRDLMSQATVIAKSIEFLKSKVDDKGGPVQITEQERNENDLFHFWDNDGKKSKQISQEDINKTITDRQAELQQYITPKDTKFIGNDGKEHTAQFSPKYTEKFLNMNYALEQIRGAAEKNAVDKVGLQTDPKNKKLSDKKYQDKYQKEYDKQIQNLYKSGITLPFEGKSKFFPAVSIFAMDNSSFSEEFDARTADFTNALTSYVDKQNKEINDHKPIEEGIWNNSVSRMTQLANDIAGYFHNHKREGLANFNVRSVSESGIDKMMGEYNQLKDALEGDLRNNQDKTQRDQRLEQYTKANLNHQSLFDDEVTPVADQMDKAIEDVTTDEDVTLDANDDASAGRYFFIFTFLINLLII